MESILPLAFILLGIWIAVEMMYYTIRMILEAFRGGPPGPNARVPAPTPKPVQAAYRPLAVQFYRRLNSTA